MGSVKDQGAKVARDCGHVTAIVVPFEGERICERCAEARCKDRAREALTDPATGQRYAWSPRAWDYR